MGFLVAEELEISRFGLSVAGCYVTLRGSVTQSKGNSAPMMPMMGASSSPYTLSGRYQIFANVDAPEALKTETISLGVDVVPEVNPLVPLYAHLKATVFAGKTLTDN